MAAETLSSMFAAPFQITGTLTITVTDDANPGGVVRSFSGGSLWYRTFLALRTGAAGTSDDPVELLTQTTNVVKGGGSLWSFTLLANGLVRANYTGTSVNGQIAWTTSTSLRNQLGFTGTLSFGHSGSEHVDATYLPNHCAFAYRRDRDTGWQERMPHGVFTRMGSGRMYGFTSGLGGMRRSFDLSAHPYDWSTRQANGMNATPAFDDEANWNIPNADFGSVPNGWSLRQFFQGVAAGSQRIGVALGNFQALAGGSDLLFHDCFLSAAGSTGEAKTEPFSPRASLLYTRKGVELEWFGKSTR